MENKIFDGHYNENNIKIEQNTESKEKVQISTEEEIKSIEITYNIKKTQAEVIFVNIGKENNIKNNNNEKN